MKKYLIPAVLACLTSTQAFAAEVVNGSFETPGVNSVSYTPPFEPNGGAFHYAPATSGNQILHLQGLASYTLDLTNLVVGQDYTTSFFAAARQNYPALAVAISYNSTLIGTFTPSSTTFTNFTGFNFTALGTTGTLTFAGLNPTASGSNDQNTGIDDVSISAVPEPATWAMMLMGFGMVGFGMRYNRKSSKVSFA